MLPRFLGMRPATAPHDHAHKYQFEDSWICSVAGEKAGELPLPPSIGSNYLQKPCSGMLTAYKLVSWICTQVDLRDHSVLFGRWVWPGAYLPIHLSSSWSGQIPLNCRAFESRLGLWRTFEGNLANNLCRRFLQMQPVWALAQLPPPPAPWPSPWGWRWREWVSLSSTIALRWHFYSLGPSPKCGEKRKNSLSLALIMSLKAAICLLGGVVR